MKLDIRHGHVTSEFIVILHIHMHVSMTSNRITTELYNKCTLRQMQTWHEQGYCIVSIL